MTSDGKQALYIIFQNIWRLFVSFNIPGTNITPGMLLVTILVISFGLRILKTFIESPDSTTINKVSK